MSKIKTGFGLLKNPKQIYRVLIYKFSGCGLSHLIPDATFLKIQYKSILGKKLNLKNPKTFNEKLQWLKLYHRNSEHMILVDKYDVKEYIKEHLGEEYVIPTLGVWDCIEDIDFDALPEKFVLKCTHDSGSTVVCKEKSQFDLESAKKKLYEKLNSNLFWHGREWPYKALKPRIIAEQYIEDPITQDLRDYKFFCFNGKVKCFKIDFDRFSNHRANYYDLNMNQLPFGEVVCPPDYNRTFDKPRNFEQMIAFAEQLSKDEPFMRVDFYNIGGKIYFGELTFFPAAGFGPFVPAEWDETLGSWIDLSIVKK